MLLPQMKIIIILKTILSPLQFLFCSCEKKNSFHQLVRNEGLIFQFTKYVICCNIPYLFCLFFSIPDKEQFQLVTWAKDSTLRLWAIEPRMIMVSKLEGDFSLLDSQGSNKILKKKWKFAN